MHTETSQVFKRVVATVTGKEYVPTETVEIQQGQVVIDRDTADAGQKLQEALQQTGATVDVVSVDQIAISATETPQDAAEIPKHSGPKVMLTKWGAPVDEVAQFKVDLLLALSEKLDEVIDVDVRAVHYPAPEPTSFEITTDQAKERLKQLWPELMAPQPQAEGLLKAAAAIYAQAVTEPTQDDRMQAYELGISVQAYRFFTGEIKKLEGRIASRVTAAAATVKLNGYDLNNRYRRPTLWR